MRRFDRNGLLAIEPKAFMGLFDDDPTPENEQLEAATVVSIRGPLVHHKSWCDSYDAIRERFAEACAAQAGTIVLRVDSPGGEVSGCIDTARALRAAAKAAGKRLVAYVEGAACSAAYALACAAERIVASPNAAVGSIGVIATRMDTTALDEAMGVRFSIVTSGEQKAYGNPHVEMSAREMQETRVLVDTLAGSLFDLVSEMRGVPAQSVAALEAGVFRGSAMKAKGLVDELATFDSLLATVASGKPAARAAGVQAMQEEEEKARKALQSILDDEDSDEKSKARARKALAAMDEDEDEKSEDDDDKPEAKAEGDDDEDKEAKAKASRSAPSVSASTAGELAAAVAEQGRLLAELRAERDSERLNSLLASRSDLPVELVKVLKTKPFAEAKAIVDAMPRKAPKPAAASTPTVTRGEGQGDGKVTTLPAGYEAQIDRAMGLTSAKRGVVVEGDRIVIGAEIAQKGA